MLKKISTMLLQEADFKLKFTVTAIQHRLIAHWINQNWLSKRPHLLLLPIVSLLLDSDVATARTSRSSMDADNFEYTS